MGACGKRIWRGAHRGGALLPPPYPPECTELPSSSQKKAKNHGPREGRIPTQTPGPRRGPSEALWWPESHPQLPDLPRKPSFFLETTKTDGKLLKRIKYVALLQRLCGSQKGEKKKSALIDLLACHVPVLSKSNFCVVVCLFVRDLRGRTNHSGHIFHCYNAETI